MTDDAKRPQVAGLVRAAGRERHDVVHLEPNAHRCACKAPIAVALQDGRARPLPDPTIPATGSVVPCVAWRTPKRGAFSAPGPRRKGTAVEAAPHLLSPAAAPFSEGTDATPNGGGIRSIAEEDVAEASARPAVKARTVGDRAVGLGEPPSMHAGAHGGTSVMVMTVCGERWLAFRATSSTT